MDDLSEVAMRVIKQLRAGDTSGAIEALTPWATGQVGDDEDRSFALELRAGAYEQAGRFDQAGADRTLKYSLCTTDETRCIVAILIARNAKQRGVFDEEVSWLRRAIEHAQADPQAHGQVAAIRLLRTLTEDAITNDDRRAALGLIRQVRGETANVALDTTSLLDALTSIYEELRAGEGPALEL